MVARRRLRLAGSGDKEGPAGREGKTSGPQSGEQATTLSFIGLAEIGRDPLTYVAFRRVALTYIVIFPLKSSAGLHMR